jgi:two-component system LytT family response regulator
MKKVVIVDDETDARQLLRYYISQHAELIVAGEAANGIEAVQLINQIKPDTVFLDIQMPGLNGFEVLAQLDEIPEIIFSTAYDQYAIKAFEVHAIDYLLKPYGKERFENALIRILKNQDNIIPLTEGILNSKMVYPQKIILHKGVRKIMVDVRTIVYGEAYGDYTKIHTTNGDYLSSRGISQLFDRLDSNMFIRVHRSHMVNKEFVTELKKSGRYYYALLQTGSAVRISDTYLPEIKKILL